MKTHLRVFAIVVFILVIGCGTASAYSKSESMQSVVINMDGAPRMVSTDKETVGELLEDLADTIDTEFYLEDAKESDPIEAMMTLSLTSVTEKTVATTEAIAYKTVERTNSSLKAGRKPRGAGGQGRRCICHQKRNLPRQRAGGYTVC